MYLQREDNIDCIINFLRLHLLTNNFQRHHGKTEHTLQAAN